MESGGPLTDEQELAEEEYLINLLCTDFKPVNVLNGRRSTTRASSVANFA